MKEFCVSVTFPKVTLVGPNLTLTAGLLIISAVATHRAAVQGLPLPALRNAKLCTMDGWAVASGQSYLENVA